MTHFGNDELGKALGGVLAGLGRARAVRSSAGQP